ncbi:hypothetical protein AAVH_02466 [Aphelenchoides avenae]|nr:hypothetical protein AAVH_02466 [Aphelenchus avenae]
MVPTAPLRPVAGAVPVVQQATAAPTVPKPPPPVAYFGEAVYDQADDPSSFTYKSDLYGAFKFVLLDEEVKERDGRVKVLRLYQCEGCLLLSKTHKYRHEQVYAIMTSGKRIVKHDPDTPRGLLHLCVRHQRSLSTTE